MIFGENGISHPSVEQRLAAQASAARVAPPDQRMQWGAAVLARWTVLGCSRDRHGARCCRGWGGSELSTSCNGGGPVQKSVVMVQRYGAILYEQAQCHGKAETPNQSYYAYPMLPLCFSLCIFG